MQPLVGAAARVADSNDAAGYDLVVNCTSQGLGPDPLPFDPHGFEMLVQQVPEYLRFFGYDALAQRLQGDLGGLRASLYPRE